VRPAGGRVLLDGAALPKGIDDCIEWGNRCTDPSLPLFAAPNTVALRGRLVTSWEPQDSGEPSAALE
jgi:hypothetical protein